MNFLFAHKQINLSGSARYMKRKEDNTTKSTLSIVYSKKTVQEEVVFMKSTKAKVDCEALDEEDTATHVVVGITWGGNCALHCTYETNKVRRSMSQDSSPIN